MARNLRQIYGQPGVLAELTRSFQAGSVVHAFLIHGDEGCGKKTLAETLSLALHCVSQGERPCMVCGPCRRMLAHVHPDHVELRPEGQVLRVDAVRALIDGLSEKPYEGGKRTVVIHEAEKMNDNAQNAFLKTLEEPDGQTVFFLLTAHPEALLPTIRSRCRPVFMPRLSEETIEKDLRLRGAEEGRAAYAARLSEGVLGRAIALLDESHPYFRCRDEAVALLSRVRETADIPGAAMAWEERRKAEDSLPFLDAMEAVLRDVLRVQAGLAPFDTQIGARLEEFARRFTIEGVACMMEETAAVRKRVSAHVQWRSAAEPLLRKIVEGAKQ